MENDVVSNTLVKAANRATYEASSERTGQQVKYNEYVIVPIESFHGERRKIEGVSHVEAEGNFVAFYNGIKVVARIDNTKFNFFLID